jgi:hypothetical protein
MSAAFLNGSQSLSAPFLLWCDCVFFAVFMGVYQGAGLCLVPLHCRSALWAKCASRVQIICGIIVMYKEFLCSGTYTYGSILSGFWCQAVPAMVRVWRSLCYLWVLISSPLCCAAWHLLQGLFLCVVSLYMYVFTIQYCVW